MVLIVQKLAQGAINIIATGKSGNLGKPGIEMSETEAMASMSSNASEKKITLLMCRSVDIYLRH